MLRFKILYLLVTFIFPFVFLVTLKTTLNVPRTIFFHLIIALLFVIVSRLFSNPFERWLRMKKREGELWTWAFDTQSPIRGSIYLIFLITTVLIQINV